MQMILKQVAENVYCLWKGRIRWRVRAALAQNLSRDVKRGFTFVSFTCRSIRSKSHQIIDFISENEVDGVIFQETLLKKTILFEFKK